MMKLLLGLSRAIDALKGVMVYAQETTPKVDPVKK